MDPHALPRPLPPFERDVLDLAQAQGWTFLTRPLDVEGGLYATLAKERERMFLLIAPASEDVASSPEALAARFESGARQLASALDLGTYGRLVYAADVEIPEAIRGALEQSGVDVWSRHTLQRLWEYRAIDVVQPARLRVREVHIQGFRGVRNLDLSQIPDDAPVVLVGPNGASKSSLLDAVAMALSWVSAMMRDEHRHGEQPRRLDRHYGAPVITIAVSAALGDRVVRWQTGRSDKDHASNSSDELLDVLRSLGWAGACGTAYTLPIVAHYGVRRAAPEDAEGGAPRTQDSADRDLRSVRRGLAGTAGVFFRWFREMEALENQTRQKEPNYRHRGLEAARRAIGSIMDGYTNLSFDRKQGTFLLHKEVPGVSADLRFEQLSDGEKMLLGMVGDLACLLARWNPGLADPLLGGGVVLIDEVDLHLHPGWQRLVAGRLQKTFPNIQWFFATHSPQVISEVPSESVVLLRVENGSVIAERPDFSAGWDTNRILKQLMGVDERPADIRAELDAVGELVHEEKHDEATRRLDVLEKRLGRFDPDVMHLRSVLDFLRD